MAASPRTHKTLINYYSRESPGVTAKDFRPGAPWSERGVVLMGQKPGMSKEDYRAHALSAVARHEMTVVDARTHLPGGLRAWTLEEHGLAYVPAPAPVADFKDRRSVTAEYYPRVAETVRSHVPGARRVIVMSHQKRTEVKSKVGSENYASGAHSDFGPMDEPLFRRWLQARHGVPEEEAKTCGICVLGVWVPIEHPAYQNPFALLDKSSIKLEEEALQYQSAFIDLGYAGRPELGSEVGTKVGKEAKRSADAKMPAASQDAPAMAPVYSPKHRWVYCPDMRTDEMLFFMNFDWRKGGSCTFHSAIKDHFHDNWADCPPRRSVDLRVLITFDPDEAGWAAPSKL